MNAARPQRKESPDGIETEVPRSVDGARVVPFPGARILTVRELRVLELMADGCEPGEIARSLSASDGSFVSLESTKSVQQRVVAKLHARSRANAVAVGLRSGLIR